MSSPGMPGWCRVPGSGSNQGQVRSYQFYPGPARHTRPNGTLPQSSVASPTTDVALQNCIVQQMMGHTLRHCGWHTRCAHNLLYLCHLLTTRREAQCNGGGGNANWAQPSTPFDTTHLQPSSTSRHRVTHGARPPEVGVKGTPTIFFAFLRAFNPISARTFLLDIAV